MSGAGKNKRKGEIFQSIRKPTAPPAQKLGADKREEKLDPVRRKAKHRKKDHTSESDADL